MNFICINKFDHFIFIDETKHAPEMHAMLARLPVITPMSIEAILATDFYDPLPQPTAPSETLPPRKKSGIKITRKPIAALIPSPEIVTLPNDGDFEIRSEHRSKQELRSPQHRSKHQLNLKDKPEPQLKLKPQLKSNHQLKQNPQLNLKDKPEPQLK